MRHSELCLLPILFSFPISAEVIERDLLYTLGPINGPFGDGQTLDGVSTFFSDEPIVIGLGDTLVLNILFDKRLEVFDFGDPTDEYFSFGLDCGALCPGGGAFSGTWLSSIEALGSKGDIWPDAITKAWVGGGIGFGWGGAGIQITGSAGSFTGIRWITTLTTVNEGDPLTLAAFTGVQMGADGIIILPADIQVTIDIRPLEEPNSINLHSMQKIPVAILTSDLFDALSIDFATVSFGPNGAAESHGRAHVEDVDSDGDMDLLLHFDSQHTGIECGDVEATLTGETFGGEKITGVDTVYIVKCP